MVNLLVVLGPSLATVYYSLTDWTGLGAAKFIGLANYRRAFADPDVREAFWHNIIWLVLFLIVPTALGLLGAYLLGRLRRGQTVFRAIYFIPYITASVVNAAVWKMFRRPVRRVELHHVPSGTVAVHEHTGESIARHVERARSIMRDARRADADHNRTGEASELFPAVTGPICGWCDLRAHCPEGQAAAPERSDWAALEDD